ncbi:hypothetical protein K501DRAFT_319346 [Backusella circina FSU 941]|nr:hypothetical protein K501DRAFT_319346 [Backusella circina FSU 941]
MPFGFGAKFCVEWARVSLWEFFSDIKVENKENADIEQPVIFAVTHHNMLLDPAVICNAYSDQYLHYWAKSSIFTGEYATRFLESTGCVPVDRNNADDRQNLYKATMDVLKLNESLVIFPEGTSHSLPRLSKLKDGASFNKIINSVNKVSLEYASSLSSFPKNADGSFPVKAAIVPVGIVYTEKSKYRSVVIVRFGEPIQPDNFLEEYQQNPKSAAKRLTSEIEKSLLAMTINSDDWESRHSATMARNILFPGEQGRMPDFIEVTQSLINVFAERESLPIVKNLCLYRESLEELSLRDSDLIRNKKLVPVTTQFIIRDFIIKTFACVANLPFSLPILVAHIPLYLIGSYYGKHELYEEVRAQDKILYCTLVLPFVYFLMFLWIWYYLYCFRFFGFFYAIITMVILVWLHVVTIDENYENFKQLRGTAQLFDSFVLGRGVRLRQTRAQLACNSERILTRSWI